MRMTIGQLRETVRKVFGGSQPDETYTMELMDDPAFEEDSVYVPNWAKKKIRAWAKDMKLSSK
jgi:hypothetical protein